MFIFVAKTTTGDEVVGSRHLFLFIGADPKTDWLASSGVELDNKGFVVTGFARSVQGLSDTGVRYPLETSVPGMFADRRRALGIRETRGRRRWATVRRS